MRNLCGFRRRWNSSYGHCSLLMHVDIRIRFKNLDQLSRWSSMLFKYICRVECHYQRELNRPIIMQHKLRRLWETQAIHATMMP